MRLHALPCAALRVSATLLFRHLRHRALEHHRGAVLRHLDARGPQDAVDDQLAELWDAEVLVEMAPREAERAARPQRTLAVLALVRPGDGLVLGHRLVS